MRALRMVDTVIRRRRLFSVVCTTHIPRYRATAALNEAGSTMLDEASR